MSTVLKYRNIENMRTKIEQIIEGIGLSEIADLVSNPPDPIAGGKEDQYLIYWGDLLDYNKFEIAENHGIRCAIVLDYDGSLVDDEVKFDDFYNKYNSKFQFYMHASWNHIIKGFDKFRVIIPVEEPYWKTKALEDVLLKVFVGCDNTTFGNRGFYIPVKRDNYRYAISEGKILNMNCFDNLVKKEIEASNERDRQLALKRDMYPKTAGTDEHKENWLRVVKDNLDSFCWGCDGSGRYSKLLKTIGSMKKHDTLRFDAFEIEEFLDEYLSHLDTKNERSLRKLIAKGN